MTDDWAAAGFSALLSVQSASFVLLRSHLAVSSCNETILLWGELFKLVFAAVVLKATSGTLSSAMHNSHEAVFPVVSYVFMNLLSFWAIQILDDVLSASLIQLKLLFTALFSTLFLGIRIPFARNCALVALCLGVIGLVFSSEDASRDSSEDEQGSSEWWELAVLALVLEAAMAGITGVYLKVILPDIRSVWTRNVQLAFMSTLLYAVKGARQGCGPVPIGPSEWVLASVSGIGGILTALATLYAGPIGRSVANASAIALVAVMKYMLLGRWPAATELTQLAAVANASLLYGLYATPLVAEARVAEALPANGVRQSPASTASKYAEMISDDPAQPAEMETSRPDGLAWSDTVGFRSWSQLSELLASGVGRRRLAAVVFYMLALTMPSGLIKSVTDADEGPLKVDLHVVSDESCPKMLTEAPLLEYLATSDAGGKVEWNVIKYRGPDDFFVDGVVDTLAAGSMVMLTPNALLNSVDNTLTHNLDRDSLRRSPRLWSLLNASDPLMIFLACDVSCATEDISGAINTTHHVLYRNTWSGPLHAMWAEQQGSPYVSLRDYSYGTEYDGGNLSKDGLSAPSPPANLRPLLFSFRGTYNTDKPSRLLLRNVEKANRRGWTAMAEALMGSSDVPATIYGRYIVDMKYDDESSEYATEYDYLDLLHDSVFSLSPDGHLWESYRTFEAMEAGSIPVIVDNATYRGCARPAAHMLARMPFVVAVQNWEDVPDVLRRVASNFSDVLARQQQMRDWLQADKTSFRSDLISTSRNMKAGSWRPRTRCTLIPLTPEVLQTHQDLLRKYWRQPQPAVSDDSVWGDVGWPMAQFPPVGKAFQGQHSFCASGSEDFLEDCITNACGLPLIESLACADATEGDVDVEAVLVAGDIKAAALALPTITTRTN